MSRLDSLYALRAKVDSQIAAEVQRLEDNAQRERERLTSLERRGWAECGTDGGYYRHRRTLGEPACANCRAAHRQAEKDRKARRAAEAANTPRLRLVSAGQTGNSGRIVSEPQGAQTPRGSGPTSTSPKGA